MLGTKPTNAIAILIGLAAVLGVSTPASAQQADFTDKSITLGVKAGAYVPSLFNDLGPHVDLALEGEWLLPFMNKQLAVALEAGWSPPTTSGKVDPDSRLGEDGSEWSYDVRTDQLFVSLGPVLRFMEPGQTFVPYLGVLARMYMIRTRVNGEADGNMFLENTEQSLELGLVGVLGGELRAGPGSVLLELSFGWSDYPHTITGDTHTGALAATLGYRFFL